MKKNILNIAFGFCILAAIATGCTENQRVKKFGGTAEIKLDKGRRLTNVTWKQDQLWVLTKEDTATKPTTYHFKEKSSYGVIEGEYTIVEQ